LLTFAENGETILTDRQSWIWLSCFSMCLGGQKLTSVMYVIW
jgi:hypothetical protein